MVGISRVAEEARKGPWTEQEDVQLALCVNVYGERRWDFVAKVSGLKVLEGDDKQYRTGKSCRLRWVNYLHPGLKRGKMTPREERLVLELHSKWGNRWSIIARKLPGRTDNEIKNYWRTHMRKQAQERKKGGGAAASATPSSSITSTTPTPTTTTTTSSSSFSTSTSTSSSAFSKSFSSVSIGNSPPTVESVQLAEKDDRRFYDTGGLNKAATPSMASPVDEIWKDMDFFGDEPIKPVYNDYGYGGTEAVASSMASPVWDYYPVPLWTMDEEAEDISKVFPPISDQFYSMNSAVVRW